MAKTPPVEDVVEHIIRQEMSEAVDTRFTTYAFMALEDRALPDARDGLKPSQRRVLVAMNDLRLTPNGGTEKSAKICGDTSGNYHPHGEAVVYPTMYRMAQPWVLRAPLIKGQGNFGNRDGDPPAAMRYTEAKMSAIGALMLEELSPEVVPFVPNYNEKRQEPTVLPAMFPNLLVNGGSGIAVGWAFNMPPHNYRELVEIFKAYATNPNLTPEEIIKLMPGPDFPTGGKILGQDGIIDYYRDGRGSVKLEGTYSIEKGSKGTEYIVVTELPYLSSPQQLCVEINDLLEDGEIQGISDANDESSKKDGMRVVIEVARNFNANLVINGLLKHTSLRRTFSVNQTVLIGGKVVPEANLLKLIEAFISHRKDILTKKYNAELAKHQARIHILEGLVRVAGSIDKTIKIIRESNSPEEAAKALITAKIVESDIQAKAVLAITLSQLTKMEASKLTEEMKQKQERVAWLRKILANSKEVMDLVIQEQEELAKRLGDERRTKVQKRVTEISNLDLIKDEKMIISLTGDGYVKSQPVESFKVQGRGGRGVNGSKDEEANMFEMFETGSKELVMFFTTKGLVYRKMAFEIPTASKTAKGTHVSNLLNLSEDEQVTNMISLKSIEQKGYMVIATRDGRIKRTEISEYDTTLKNTGLVAIKLAEKDQVAFAMITDGKKDIFIVTKSGLSVRYNESILSSQGRATQGVNALKLEENDTIAQVCAFDKNDNPKILLVTAKGHGKRTDAAEFKSYGHRNVKGIAVMKRSAIEKQGGIAGAVPLEDGDGLLVMTQQGKVIRIETKEIRETSRTATGVRLVRMDDGDAVSKIARLAKVEETVNADS